MARRSTAGARGRRDESVRRRRGAPRSQWKPPDSDGPMTSTRDFTDTGSSEGAELERLRAEVAEWRRRYANGELRDIGFTNSANEVEPVYTALDVDRDSSDT